MKRFSILMLVICFFLLSYEAQAQENFTERTVWRVILLDIKPGKGTEFWQDMRQNLKPLYEQYKKQGIISGYTVNLKSTADEPGDWDVAIGLEYKNFAALDGLAARTDPITLKFYGNVEARRAANVKRSELATTVSSFLMREVTLKDMPR